ncbi:MAG TPA: hypothetical protein PLT09_00600 [Deltaproteobacteria bacterium]|nr:hypothetical protein [Deltaproteobacteria bacterium]HPR54181.1 hypothetical protein [Deltaproteobacteria bacterium]HXK45908.1 hypothetical protein [Deltaproteobacteria bacterium]
MARYILKDEKYTQKPLVFESYKDMIDKVRAVCKEKKKDFSDKDEKSLKFEVEKVMD